MEREFDKDEEIKKIDAKIKDAEENLGNEEVRDATIEKAELYLKIGDSAAAIETFNKALKLSVGVSKKMEIEFSILLIYVKEKNLDKIREHLDIQHKFLLDGGDWEKKNKLKVYEGIYNLMVREFGKASKLLLDCLATFNSPEVISFNELVYYTVLTSIISLQRGQMKQKVVHSPDILSCIRELPTLKAFLECYVKCDYKGFFIQLHTILQNLVTDKYLAPHRKYFTREMRVMIYSQFMESYKTVTLQNMAEAFGVSTNFIDRELSELISARRLACKIDKVAGVVESERMDKRNNLYKAALKEGDFLLNRVQKLSRVIDI